MFRAYRNRKVVLCGGSSRQVKNLCFSLAMLVQVLFWTYMLFTQDTKGFDEEQTFGNRFVKDNDGTDLHASSLLNRASYSPSGQSIVVQNVHENDKMETSNMPQVKYLDEVLKMEKEVEASAELDFSRYFNKQLHHTILPRNASVVWDKSYLKNPHTICSRHSDLDLLLIVHTAPYNFRRRNMIRDQLRNVKLYTVQTLFMIGTMADGKVDADKEDKIKREFKQFGDFVQMDFQEDFRNLSLKAVMWLRWANVHCKNAQMILKIDDDVVIDFGKILPLSRGVFSKYKRSIFCHLNKIGSQPIPRVGRTNVDPREFMRMSFYPYNYCSGFIVFLTPDLIPSFEETVKTIPFYNVDDVFMFGMVPKLTGLVTYHNIGYNVSIWNNKVLKCNRDQGLQCPYFGTMGEEEEVRKDVWDAMNNNHAHEFHFPQLHIL